MKEVDKKLIRHGYRREGKYGSVVMYQRGKIKITIDIRIIENDYDTEKSDVNSKVERYEIELISTDKYNKGYYE